MRFYKILTTSLVLATLSACSYLPEMPKMPKLSELTFPGVYKINIQQGNVITPEMIDQLRPGMSKRQVIFIMGTPLIHDPFHQNRWDYLYSASLKGKIREQERIALYFEDEKLSHFEGDLKPSAASGPAEASSQNQNPSQASAAPTDDAEDTKKGE